MPKFSDLSLSFEERAKDLVDRMTLREKMRQMIYFSPAIKRLNIKKYNWWNECLHGVGRAGVATVFPQAIALAATFDPKFMLKVATVISDEARAKHHEFQRKKKYGIYKGLTFWSPNINIFRDPRWGRGQETYGEDPFLTAQMGINFVRGLQGDDPKYLKLVATPKHYVVHSGPEAERHSFNAISTKKDMYETFLFAFKECIEKAGAYSIMGAYNRTNGEVCCGSPTLLQKILRDEFKFQGYVVSDCGAIGDFHKHHKVTKNSAQSAALAINNGCDLNCGMAYMGIRKAVKKKLLPLNNLDTSVYRLMLARMKLGMFDPTERVPYASIPFSVNDCEKHRSLAISAAEKSIVLLKNAENFLPLENQISTIAVIGPNTDDHEVLWGNYNGTPSKDVTLLQGIKNYSGKNVTVHHAKGCYIKKGNQEMIDEATAIAQKSDVIILGLGISQLLEGEESKKYREGDRNTLALPDAQLVLLASIQSLNKPIVLVILNGSPILLKEMHDNSNIKAIIEAWYPGEEGGTAFANILFGKTSPSGRLPITFPASMDELPPIRDYSMEGRTYRYLKMAPQYPFGYGLSYSHFEYSEIELSDVSPKIGESLEIKIKVSNKGNITADEIVQLYLKDIVASVNVPHHSLQGVQRITLSPGELKTINFNLEPRQMALINEEGKAILEPGEFTIYIGGTQPDTRSFELTGTKIKDINFSLSGEVQEIKY